MTVDQAVKKNVLNITNSERKLMWME